MNTENGQGQSQRNRNSRKERLGSFEEKSGGVGNESNKIINLDSQGTNINESDCIRRRRKIIGGMLSQLIKDTRDQLAFCQHQVSYYNEQIQSLEKKLSNLENLDVFYEDEIEQ